MICMRTRDEAESESSDGEFDTGTDRKILPGSAVHFSAPNFTQQYDMEAKVRAPMTLFSHSFCIQIRLRLFLFSGKVVWAIAIPHWTAQCALFCTSDSSACSLNSTMHHSVVFPRAFPTHKECLIPAGASCRQEAAGHLRAALQAEDARQYHGLAAHDHFHWRLRLLPLRTGRAHSGPRAQVRVVSLSFPTSNLRGLRFEPLALPAGIWPCTDYPPPDYKEST